MFNHLVYMCRKMTGPQVRVALSVKKLAKYWVCTPPSVIQDPPLQLSTKPIPKQLCFQKLIKHLVPYAILLVRQLMMSRVPLYCTGNLKLLILQPFLSETGRSISMKVHSHLRFIRRVLSSELFAKSWVVLC